MPPSLTHHAGPITYSPARVLLTYLLTHTGGHLPTRGARRRAGHGRRPHRRGQPPRLMHTRWNALVFTVYCPVLCVCCILSVLIKCYSVLLKGAPLIGPRPSWRAACAPDPVPGTRVTASGRRPCISQNKPDRAPIPSIAKHKPIQASSSHQTPNTDTPTHRTLHNAQRTTHTPFPPSQQHFRPGISNCCPPLLI